MACLERAPPYEARRSARAGRTGRDRLRRHSGIDGAHGTLLDEQAEVGRLEDHASDALPLGVDIAGVLVVAVLKVGHLLNRGHATNAHYGEVHSWNRAT